MDGSGRIEDWDVGGERLGALQVEVGVVGAGLAGAILALVLARRGVRVAVADLHDSRRSDFRCEKFSPAQLDLLAKLGVRADIEPQAVGDGGLEAEGFRYETVVNAVRAAWPPSVRLHPARVSQITTLDGWTRVSSRDGALFDARVAVVAAGSSPAMMTALGVEREMIRAAHSFCLGYTLERSAGLPPEGLIHPGERAGDGVGFVSLFPLGDGMRVNLFGYLAPRDPWLQSARQDPIAATLAAAPGLTPLLRGARLAEAAELRFTDLYRTPQAARPGLVLIGDAYQTCCPATGLGVTRLLTDVQRLADVHLPAWLMKDAVSAADIAAFYADPVKTAVDRDALARAERSRRMAVETSPAWRARRLLARTRRLARRLGRRAPAIAAPPAAAATAAFSVGDWVEVRPASEILATLDAAGRFEGLPFMPEMAALIGRRLQVRRLTTQTCVEGHGLRTMSAAVMLDGARCDGAAHDGCQRGCLTFWKTAWLRPAGAARPDLDPAVEALALERLLDAPVRDGPHYVCQSTVLAEATQPLDRGSVALLRHNMAAGELAPTRAAEIVGRAVAKRALRAVGKLELGGLKGEDGKTVEVLDLQPGERVRVRSTAEIARTLDAHGKNRGMAYEAEMSMYAGRTFVVAGRVDRMIHEETGKMIPLRATVKLEGLNCQGRCALNCSRANPLYWREAWLERVE